MLSDFFWLDNLLCTGFEFSLADCKANNFEFENCYASEGVSVECNPNCKLDISGTSLVGTPGDRLNVYSLSGIRINQYHLYRKALEGTEIVFVLTGISYLSCSY